MFIVQSYTFAPGDPGAGTITVTGTLNLEDFGVITNVTKNSVIYDPAEGQAGATVAYGAGTTILTLEQSTTYCDPADKLQIVVLPELVDGKVPVDIGTNIDVTIENTSIEVSNDAGNPIPVSDAGGSLTVDSPNLTSIDGKLPALVGGKIPVDASVSITGVATEAKQDVIISDTSSIAGLKVPAHDYISLSYTGTNLTSIVYKTGGSGGTTVATLTLAYSGSQLISVSKS